MKVTIRKMQPKFNKFSEQLVENTVKFGNEWAIIAENTVKFGNEWAIIADQQFQQIIKGQYRKPVQNRGNS